MTKKPTYEELEQRVRELEEEFLERKQVEDALRESEVRLSNFMNSASDSMYLFDSNLNFVEVNKRGLEIIGKKREDVVGKNITDIVPDIKESGRYEKHLEVIKTGKPFEIDDFVSHPIFGNLHFVLKSFKVSDGLGVIASDITDRRHAEEALRESEEIYRSIISESPVGISIYDKSGQCVDANDSIIRIVGATKEQVLQQNYNNLESWKKSGMLDKAKIAVKEQTTKRHELIIETTFGKEVKLDCYLVPFKSGGLLLMVSDITEQKLAEMALKESEERYRSLFKNNHSVMLLIDPKNADIVDANPAAISFYGWSHKELTSKKITDINTLTEEQIFQEMEKAKLEHRRHFIFRHRLSNRDIRDVEVYSGPIKLHGQDLLYSIIHDITDRKQVEEEREKLINELQEAIKEIKTLRGILPLCSFCKKIRDDKGYWEQVDVYIHKYSQADISHSICPECAKEHYPDLDNYDD
jgi:PAS domain S-box-containing protein